MIDLIARFSVYRLYLPLRCFAHAFHLFSRNIRVRLGLRKPFEKKKLQIPLKPWEELCSCSGVVFKEMNEADGNVDVVELAVINALCRTSRPSMIMEIGTFDGRTTLNLALNSEAQIFTLDIPQDTETAHEVAPGDVPYLNKPVSAIGARFASPPNSNLSCTKRITQLYGDSASFDFSEFRKKIDFFFVDGSHSYEYLKNDTRVALELLNPAGGVIVWHDYGEWQGVTKGLEEIMAANPALQLYNVRDTSLVVAIFDSKEALGSLKEITV